MDLYKIKDPNSKLFWKGGGMNKNNKSSSFINVKNEDGSFTYREIDKSSEEDALKICFSKNGKTWGDLRSAMCALAYGHEPGLNSLLKKCELVKVKILEQN